MNRSCKQRRLWSLRQLIVFALGYVTPWSLRERGNNVVQPHQEILKRKARFWSSVDVNYLVLFSMKMRSNFMYKATCTWPTSCDLTHWTYHTPTWGNLIKLWTKLLLDLELEYFVREELHKRLFRLFPGEISGWFWQCAQCAHVINPDIYQQTINK